MGEKEEGLHGHITPMTMTQEESFIQAFVQRERRERARIELSSATKRGAFFSRLCHRYADVLDTRSLHRVPRSEEDPARVAAYLRQQGAPSHSYVLSTMEAIDGSVMPLDDALARIFFHGLPSLLLCVPGKLGYFQAEQVAGPPPRFFLERR